MTKQVTKKGKFHQWKTGDGLIKLEAWARDGLIDEEIADKMGINPSTLYVWKNKYTEIAEALTKGKEVVDIRVENALLKRALGFTYEETKIVQEKDAYGKDKKRQEKTTKTVVPDVGAQIFWLKNRKRNEWRDKQDIEHSGKLGVTIVDDIK